MLDAWISSNYILFLEITVHWISEDWQLKEILIDFCKLSGSHSGENLHEFFIQCCDNMRILTKICFYIIIVIIIVSIILYSFILLYKI